MKSEKYTKNGIKNKTRCYKQKEAALLDSLILLLTIDH